MMIKMLWRKTHRDVRASLAQSLALVLIITLGIGSFIALVGAYRDLSTSYQHTYDQTRFADAAFTLQSAPPTAVARVARLDGVAAAAGRLIVETGLQPPAEAEDAPAGIRARLIGIPPGEHPSVNDVLVMKGRFLQKNDIRAVLIESHFAEAYDLHPGDRVTALIGGQPIDLKVAGVAASPEYLVVSPSKQEIVPSARTFAVLFMPLPELQKLSGVGDIINDLDIRLTQHGDSETIAAVQGELNQYGLISTTLREDQPSNSALQLDLEGYHELAYLLPCLILLVAAASVYVMLGRHVRAQQPQIGLMKALGYGNRAVLTHYLTLALTIGAIGSILGVLLGLPLVAIITTGYANELGIPLVETRFYPDLVGLGVLLSLVFTALAGLGPARGSARLAPARAMRMDPASAMVKGRPTILERLIKLPLGLRLPLRNVFRMRRRAFSTVLGVIFAFVLILASWGMIDSMNIMLQQNFQSENWDELALFGRPQTQATLGRLRNLPGVLKAEPLIQLPATLAADGQAEDILLSALAPTQDMHQLHLDRDTSSAQALAPGQIVLTTGMARKFRLDPGDSVGVRTVFGTYRFTVAAVSDELMGAAAYIPLAEAQKWLGMSAFNAVYLRTDPRSARQVEKDLYLLPDVVSVQSRSDMESDWNSMMGLFYAFIGVILIFAAAMAFALIFNAMTVNVLERRRELATLRAIGTTGRRAARQMLTESVIFWLIALPPGLLLGAWVAEYMGAAFSSELFSFSIVIAPATYVYTAVGILLTMILAALPAIRRVNRLNLAEATKVLA